MLNAFHELQTPRCAENDLLFMRTKPNVFDAGVVASSKDLCAPGVGRVFIFPNSFFYQTGESRVDSQPKTKGEQD